jgi:hypothetical protein
MASPTIKSYAKAGFGVMGGAIAAQLIFMAIGLMFFLIGMRMLAGARKQGSSPVPAYIFMGIGVVVGLGLGAGIFFENVAKNMGLSNN